MIASSGASRRVATGAITIGNAGRSTTGVSDGCCIDTSLNPVPCSVIRPDGPGHATPQPSHTDDRRRAATQLLSGRDGRRGASGGWPPGHVGQPLSDMKTFRVERGGPR
jgi:hypothetical protein